MVNLLVIFQAAVQGDGLPNIAAYAYQDVHVWCGCELRVAMCVCQVLPCVMSEVQ